MQKVVAGHWRLEWKREVKDWNQLKGKGRGKKPLLGEKKVVPKPAQPSTDVVEDLEVSFTILHNSWVGS